MLLPARVNSAEFILRHLFVQGRIRAERRGKLVAWARLPRLLSVSHLTLAASEPGGSTFQIALPRAGRALHRTAV